MSTVLVITLTLCWALSGLISSVLCWRATWQESEPKAEKLSFLVVCTLFGLVAAVVCYANYLAYRVK